MFPTTYVLFQLRLKAFGLPVHCLRPPFTLSEVRVRPLRVLVLYESEDHLLELGVLGFGWRPEPEVHFVGFELQVGVDEGGRGEVVAIGELFGRHRGHSLESKGLPGRLSTRGVHGLPVSGFTGMKKNWKIKCIVFFGFKIFLRRAGEGNFAN